MDENRLPSSHTIGMSLGADQVDYTGRMTLAALLQACQTIAGIHADRIGAGRDDIMDRGYIWVIARILVDLPVCPVYGQEVELMTWPGNKERIVFPRYFRLSDASGKTLGTVTSLYTLLDVNTRAIVPASRTDVYPAGFVHLEETNPAPGRFHLKPEGDPVLLRIPVYSDLDLNGHMNNARYAQWICDLFRADRFRDSWLRKVQINYMSEGIEGEPIALYLNDSGAAFEVCGTDAGGTVVFEASGEWA